MKRLPIVAAALFFASCAANNGGTTVTPTPASGSGFRSWIKHWRGGDTLLGSTYTSGLNYGDTVFTERVGDTSFIRYKGVRYYIFIKANGLSNANDTNNEQSIVAPVTFNTRPDTVGEPVKKIIMSVAPAAYKTDQGERRTQQQKFIGCPEPFFPRSPSGAGMVYFSRRVYP